MKLYMKSNLPEESYFKAMTACAICGYVNTAMKVCMDKVNEENVEFAISELENFCKIKNEKDYINDISRKVKVIKYACKYNEDVEGANIITAYSWCHIYDLINKLKYM